MTAFTTRPEILGTFGVVTSTHWIATAVGMSILERGGNAFDAAVATGFVLQIVEPHLVGPGGDMPAVIYSKKKDKVEVICAQAPAPADATIEHYTSEGLTMIPGDGLLATVIPGSFDGWMLMLRDYGTMSVRDVLEPAIYYAEHGHPVLPRVAATIEGLADFFEKEWPTSYRHLAARRRRARSAFECQEPGARGNVEAHRRGGGSEDGARSADRGGPRRLLSRLRGRGDPTLSRKRGSDGRQRQSSQRRSHRRRIWPAGRRRSRSRLPTTITTGRSPRSDHGARDRCCCSRLSLLKGFDLGAMDPAGADFVHTVVEAMKLAFADRDVYYGDPKFSEVPMAHLLSDAYAAERRRLISKEASFDLRPGKVAGFRAAIRFDDETARCGFADRRRLRADHGASFRKAWRHRPYRCHRPARQHGLRDTFRRLAAVITDRARTSVSASIRAPRCSG